MRKRPLMLMACVFLTGLVYQKYALKGLVVVEILLILREWWFGRKAKSYVKTAGRSILLLSAFLLGIFHMQQESDFRAAYMSKMEDGSRRTVWGEIINTETTEYGFRAILSDCYIRQGEEIIPCNDIMVYTSEDHFQMGQIHRITGKVKMFSRARNEGNFDSCTYYQSLKIDFALEEEEYTLIGVHTNPLGRGLLSLKEEMSQVYAACMEKKAAGFYQAMVLGNKMDLDENLKSLFLLGGISHILVISGLHVSILGKGFYRILRHNGIGFGMAGLCGGFLLLSYGVMVGNSTSTVRAVGMMILFFLAQWIGRSYDMLNSLGGMVLFLLWENPFLIENSGFWFSVTALLGVGYVGRELSARKDILKQTNGDKSGVNRNMKKTRRVEASGLWMSLGITLATLPVTALSYYEVPLYSPLVNFVVLPLLTPIFCLAVIGGLLGAMFPGAGFVVVLLQPCQWLLAFYEWVCTMVSHLPGASIICGKPEGWQVVLHYVLLFGGIYVLRFCSESKERKHICAAILILGCSLCIFFPKAKPFEITFLDVGQGDGIYISAGDGSTYFIDGGSSNVNGVGEYRILPFLKSKGVKEIDYWFVSHCDTDHISGLLEILENGYKIEHIVLHERCSKEENNILLINLANKIGVEVIYMTSGDRICSTNMEIGCLAPLAEDSVPMSHDENENSLVLQVEWKPQKGGEYFTALFAGDISSEVETRLCEAGVLEDVDLFKANHHGSNYSNSTILLDVIQPEYIVVSCSSNNLYGHPGVQAVERMEISGAEIFYTMDGGQITFPLLQ